VIPQLSVFELDVWTSWEEGVPPHVHDHLDAFYVLEGEVEFLLGDETVPATAGTLVASPPGVRHGIGPIASPARLLNLHAPDAGFAESLQR
jgi:quercetin dioxygenase-like cupin family protein